MRMFQSRPTRTSIIRELFNLIFKIDGKIGQTNGLGFW